jgi:hypothetical protein
MTEATIEDNYIKISNNVGTVDGTLTVTGTVNLPSSTNVHIDGTLHLNE